MREAERADDAAMRLTMAGLARVWMGVAVELDQHGILSPVTKDTGARTVKDVHLGEGNSKTKPPNPNRVPNIEHPGAAQSERVLSEREGPLF
jgi:hypothetical protein